MSMLEIQAEELRQSHHRAAQQAQQELLQARSGGGSGGGVAMGVWGSKPSTGTPTAYAQAPPASLAPNSSSGRIGAAAPAAAGFWDSLPTSSVAAAPPVHRSFPTQGGGSGGSNVGAPAAVHVRGAKPTGMPWGGSVGAPFIKPSAAETPRRVMPGGVAAGVMLHAPAPSQAKP